MKLLLLMPYLCRKAGDSCGELETPGFILYESNTAASSASTSWRCLSGNFRCMVVVCSSFSWGWIFCLRQKGQWMQNGLYLSHSQHQGEVFMVVVPSRPGTERRNLPGTCVWHSPCGSQAPALAPATHERQMGSALLALTAAALWLLLI